MTQHRRLRGLLRRAGVDVRRLGDRTVLASMAKQQPKVNRLDEHAWLVQRPQGRPRAVRAIGPPRIRSHLLTDRRAVRAHPGRHLRTLTDYVAREHISWMLRELEINCVLDVGANLGQYAHLLRKGGYNGRIVSFEPVSSLAADLRKAADGDPEWHVIECALGDADTTAEMNVRPGAMSSLLPSSDFGMTWSNRLRERASETIRVRRLDGVFDECVDGLDEPRVYLKMDTQGYDLQTFAGAGERLSEVLGMQSEVSCVPIYDGMPRLPEQISRYEEAGFEITGMFPVTRDPSTLRIIEFDVVMVRPSAVSRTR